MTWLAIDIAFLKDVGAFPITLMCMVPAIAFMVYVFVDDARQARAHRQEQLKGGQPPH
jgi:hypothetical protein